MVGWEDVRRLALALPGATEETSRGLPHWRVGDKLFVWERPLRRKDREALGAGAPKGPVLGVRVADVGEKASLIEAHPDAIFTVPHFDGYPSVLVQLDHVEGPLLEELIVDAWRCRAPKRFLKERGDHR